MKKTVLPLFFSALVIIGAPSFASAIGISLSYALNFFPPNPCVDSSLTGSIGIYDPTGDGSPLAPNPGPQEFPLFSLSSPGFSEAALASLRSSEEGGESQQGNKP